MVFLSALSQATYKEFCANKKQANILQWNQTLIETF